MSDAAGQVVDLVFGRWRSQILAAGTELGTFDHLDRERPRTAAAVAAETGLDPALLYRLLRAQAAIGLLAEDADGRFVLTESGALLRSDHPRSLAAMARLEEGPQHYALWKHLPAMVADGRQNAFLREFGRMAFDHTRADRDYAERFDRAMSSFSAVQAEQVLAALGDAGLEEIEVFCDVAGGHGYMACALLQAYPRLSGIVLDLPEVVADHDKLWARKLGLESRCRYLAGDMFAEVPAADAYGLKMILHDWTDDQCVTILENLRRAAVTPARVFVMEHVVPGPETPHFAKLFDVHMLCWGSGRERTEAEYAALLQQAGWEMATTHSAPGCVMSVVEGRCG